jgi:hypothetical protein
MMLNFGLIFTVINLRKAKLMVFMEHFILQEVTVKKKSFRIGKNLMYSINEKEFIQQTGALVEQGRVNERGTKWK